MAVEYLFFIHFHIQMMYIPVVLDFSPCPVMLANCLELYSLRRKALFWGNPRFCPWATPILLAMQAVCLPYWPTGTKMWRLPLDSVLRTFSSRALTPQDQFSITQVELNWVYQLDVTRGKRENSRSVNHRTLKALTIDPLPPVKVRFFQQTLDVLTNPTSKWEQENKVILGSNTYLSTIFLLHNHFCARL